MPKHETELCILAAIILSFPPGIGQADGERIDPMPLINNTQLSKAATPRAAAVGGNRDKDSMNIHLSEGVV